MQPAFLMAIPNMSQKEPGVSGESKNQLSLTLVEKDLASPFVIPQTATMQSSPDASSPIMHTETVAQTVHSGEESHQATHRKPIKRRTSVWDLFRRDTTADTKPQEEKAVIPIVQAVEQVCEAELSQGRQSSEPAIVGEEEAVKAVAEKAVKRRSSSILSIMPWYAKAGRRDVETGAKGEGSVDKNLSKIKDIGNIVDNEIPVKNQDKRLSACVPSQAAMLDMHSSLLSSGKKVAEDMVRFAHARHLIKVTDNIDVVRSVAFDLDEAFRAQVDKVSYFHSQYEALTWRLHDLSDENKHLRNQLGLLSEKIVKAHFDNAQLKEQVNAVQTSDQSPNTTAHAKTASISSSASSSQGAASADDSLHRNLDSIKITESSDNTCIAQSPVSTILFSATMLSASHPTSF